MNQSFLSPDTERFVPDSENLYPAPANVKFASELTFANPLPQGAGDTNANLFTLNNLKTDAKLGIETDAKFTIFSTQTMIEKSNTTYNSPLPLQENVAPAITLSFRTNVANTYPLPLREGARTWMFRTDRERRSFSG